MPSKDKQPWQKNRRDLKRESGNGTGVCGEVFVVDCLGGMFSAVKHHQQPFWREYLYSRVIKLNLSFRGGHTHCRKQIRFDMSCWLRRPRCRPATERTSHLTCIELYNWVSDHPTLIWGPNWVTWTGGWLQLQEVHQPQETLHSQQRRFITTSTPTPTPSHWIQLSTTIDLNELCSFQLNQLALGFYFKSCALPLADYLRIFSRLDYTRPQP